MGAATSEKVEVQAAEKGADPVTVQVSMPDADSAGRNDLTVPPVLPENTESNTGTVEDQSGDTNGERAKAELNAKSINESGISENHPASGEYSFESTNFVVFLSNSTSRAGVRIIKRGTIGDDLTVSGEAIDELIKVLAKAKGAAKKESWI